MRFSTWWNGHLIEEIVTHSHLKELHVIDAVPSEPNQQCPPTLQPGFRSLTVLTINALKPQDGLLVGLLESIHDPSSLATIGVRLNTRRTSNGRTVLDALSRFRNLIDVDIEVNGYGTSGGIPVVPVISPQEIQGFLLCPAIESFQIRCLRIGVDLLSSTIRDMSVAWPRLRRLSLIDGRHQPPSSTSFGDLQHLVERCPNLEDLWLNFDTRGVVPHASPSSPAAAFRVLHVQHSTITQRRVALVTRQLAQCWPKLLRLEANWNSGLEQRLWGDVARALGARYFASGLERQP